MKSDEEQAEGAQPADWSRVGLDWIDLLIIVAFAIGMTVLFQAIGWRPRGAAVGFVLAPPLIAALVFRRRVLPPARRGRVVKRLSALGLSATMLMVFGLLVGVFGAVGAWNRLSVEAAPVDEQNVRTLARARAQLEMTPQVGEAVSAKEAAMHDAGATGTFDELMAVIERGPSDEMTARQEVEVRRQLTLEAEERAAAQRAGGVGFAIRAGLLAFAMIALGGWLDSRRARVAPERSP